MLDDARKPAWPKPSGPAASNCCLCRGMVLLSNDGAAGQARREERDRSLEGYKAADCELHSIVVFLQPCVGGTVTFKRR